MSCHTRFVAMLFPKWHENPEGTSQNATTNYIQITVLPYLIVIGQTYIHS